MRHSFFRTAGGRFGLATSGCKTSDKVCVLYGGRPLYTIRPHRRDSVTASNDAESSWEFVGIAYVPLLMDQHTKDDARAGPYETFTLA